jgi:hypothetical protein
MGLHGLLQEYLYIFFLEANSSNALAKSVSVLDTVNWIGLAVKKTKAETVKRCSVKAGIEESDVGNNLEEASETLLQYLISAEEKNLPVIKELCSK